MDGSASSRGIARFSSRSQTSESARPNAMSPVTELGDTSSISFPSTTIPTRGSLGSSRRCEPVLERLPSLRPKTNRNRFDRDRFRGTVRHPLLQTDRVLRNLAEIHLRERGTGRVGIVGLSRFAPRAPNDL